MTFRQLILWSIIGHFVLFGVLFVLGFVRLHPRAATEILRPVNVQMVARELPPEPPPPAPEPEPPPPPPRPERVIRPDPPEPDPEVADLQQRELEELLRRQREREEREEQERLQREELERIRNRPPPEPEPREAVSVSTASVSLGSYEMMLISSISRHWLTNREWVNTDLAVRIQLRVHRDGSFSEIHLITPSGNEAYDRAALSTLLDHPQGPPLPDFIAEDSLQVTVRMVPQLAP
jgi:outer membrane biosynthesis protein TonB